MSQNDINLDGMTRDELKVLRGQVERALADYDERKRKKAMAEVEKVAKEHGFAVSDLLNKRKGRKPSKQAPRYRHPENPEITWSGRGRPPAWIREHVEAGGDKEDFAIK